MGARTNQPPPPNLAGINHGICTKPLINFCGGLGLGRGRMFGIELMYVGVNVSFTVFAWSQFILPPFPEPGYATDIISLNGKSLVKREYCSSIKIKILCVAVGIMVIIDGYFQM